MTSMCSFALAGPDYSASGPEDGVRSVLVLRRVRIIVRPVGLVLCSRDQASPLCIPLAILRGS
jgi:hypothetical protein